MMIKSERRFFQVEVLVSKYFVTNDKKVALPKALPTNAVRRRSLVRADENVAKRLKDSHFTLHVFCSCPRGVFLFNELKSKLNRHLFQKLLYLQQSQIYT
jgi:hypothetical protein